MPGVSPVTEAKTFVSTPLVRANGVPFISVPVAKAGSVPQINELRVLLPPALINVFN